MKKPVVICIDDESIILNSLKIELRTAAGADFLIETAESGQDALEIAQELLDDGVPIPLVISDYIMPEMKGDEALIKIHALSPKTLKIMLTGQSSLEGITNAINNANLYRFISKPWSSNDLIMTVKQAIKSYQQDREIEQTNKALAELNASLEQKVILRTQEIEHEREKSENLLLNIFPKQVAQELKGKGKVTPKFYEKVSVLFTDFKGFTQISSKLTPQEIITELNYCFSVFDAVCAKYHLEKIKTIGDAYMCAGGIPIENNSNPIDAINAAIEMLEFIGHLKRLKEAENKPVWELRIGIHTGSVVAGVVGTHKFAYDIWGDAVNTASRMESSGEAGKINISGTTYEYVKHHFKCAHRGKIQVKGKGELDMYFVEGRL